MRVDGFWMGWLRLSRDIPVSKIAREAGGWSELRNTHRWAELGLTPAQQRILRTTPGFTTRGVALTADDPRYPHVLHGEDAAPPVFFVEGDLDALDAPAVGIVGTRKCTAYGRAVADDLGFQLADGGVTVISGLALGIDAAAHRGAVRGGRSVAVLAHGLDHTAPQSHSRLRRQILETGGAMITTWPDHTPPLPYRFPLRNRWIAGLSNTVVIVEAPAKSGALHTVNAAGQMGRTVAVVPGPIGSPVCEGSNDAMRHGGVPIVSVGEFVRDFCGSHRERDAWLSALFAGATLEDVAVLRGGSVVDLLEELRLLEALGRVVRLPGRRYAGS